MKQLLYSIEFTAPLSQSATKQTGGRQSPLDFWTTVWYTLLNVLRTFNRVCSTIYA